MTYVQSRHAATEIIMTVSSEVNRNPARMVVRPERYGGGPTPEAELPPAYSEQPPQTIIRETIIVQPPLKDGPMFFPCPSCSKRVMTRVDYVNTRKTHMIAGFICGFTFWCFLCCLASIPYLIPTFKKVKHYCSECNLFLGDYTKM